MNPIKKIILAVTMCLPLLSTGCMLDEVYEPYPVVVYRVGFGYGYWHQGYWYAAPPGYIYRPGPPTWGPPHYRGGPGRPFPPPPPPPYRGPRVGGWRGHR